MPTMEARPCRGLTPTMWIESARARAGFPPGRASLPMTSTNIGSTERIGCVKRARLTISSTSSGRRHAARNVVPGDPPSGVRAAEHVRAVVPDGDLGSGGHTDGAEPDRGEGDEGPARAMPIARTSIVVSLGRTPSRQWAIAPSVSAPRSPRAAARAVGANDVKREGRSRPPPGGVDEACRVDIGHHVAHRFNRRPHRSLRKPAIDPTSVRGRARSSGCLRSRAKGTRAVRSSRSVSGRARFDRHPRSRRSRR